MTITLNGNGTVTGISVGGLPNGIVNTDTLSAEAKRTYAHFIFSDASTHLNLSATGGGQHVHFSHVKSQQGITGDTSDNDWTHATTGYYQLQIRYRQQSGGDFWSLFGVTKDGASNCVGVSVRTGSEDGRNEGFDVLYTVDSTSSTYQLMGWVGSGTKDICDPDAQGKPTWTNYDTLVGYSNANGGIQLDIIINKIGDL